MIMIHVHNQMGSLRHLSLGERGLPDKIFKQASLAIIGLMQDASICLPLAVIKWTFKNVYSRQIDVSMPVLLLLSTRT